MGPDVGIKILEQKFLLPLLGIELRIILQKDIN